MLWPPSRRSQSRRERAIALALAELLTYAEDSRAADEFYERAAGQGDAADADRDGWRGACNGLPADQPHERWRFSKACWSSRKDTQQQGPIYFYLAAALALDDRFDEALAAARQAAERVPNVPTIQLRPAWVLFLAKRWPEAAQAYQDFLARYGDQYGISCTAGCGS